MDYNNRVNDSAHERLDLPADQYANRGGDIMFSGSKSNDDIDPSLNP